MSDNPKPLKSQNSKYILSILALDILVITLALEHLNIILLPTAWMLPLASGISATTVSVFALAANHLLPRWVKEIMVFLRFKDVQPGCRAFSVRAGKDTRVSVSSLEKIVGIFPTAGNAQNALWYKLLKQNEGKASVQQAHKNYLLFRDLASLSLTLCVLIGIPLLIYSLCATTEYLFGWFVLQYIVCMIAAQNSGNSLVDNVLAEASCQ